MTNYLHQSLINEYGQEFLTSLLNNDENNAILTYRQQENLYKTFEPEILETLKQTNYKELSFEPLDVIISDRLLRALEA